MFTVIFNVSDRGQATRIVICDNPNQERSFHKWTTTKTYINLVLVLPCVNDRRSNFRQYP